MTKSEFSAVAAPAASATFSLGFLDEAPPQDGVLLRQKVFRTGKFTDSLGRENEWTEEHLDQMVEHFELLKQMGSLPNVPVRIDHTKSMRDVVGWFRRIYRDLTEPNFLFADIEFTEPDAYQKWERKTLRNRSIEIGEYETNTGERYAPVVLGLAFVDLPAVEGLFGRQAGSPSSDGNPASDDQSSNPGDPDSASNHTKGNPMPNENEPQVFRINGEDTSDHSAVQAYIATLESQLAAASSTQSFRLNGQETDDAEAVQSHINSLETFRMDAIEDGRKSFVSDLAKEGKITNPQIESFNKLVTTMSHEQFDDFKAGFESAPAQNLFGTHDLGDGGAPDPVEDRKAQEIADLEEIVANHRRRGVSDEDLKGMKSFQRLESLKAQS